MGQGLRRLLAVFLLLGVVLELLPALALAGTEETVRVAYVLTPNVMEGEEGEQKYGYGYEYLQKISYYTGWQYDYVYGTFAESLARLEAGEIDLIAGVAYGEDRDILYSTQSEAEEEFYLYSYISQSGPTFTEVSELEGKTVGVCTQGAGENTFRQWMTAQGLQCQTLYYDDEEELAQDLADGVLYAVVDSELAGPENWLPVAMIGAESYYFGVSKSRPDLLQELNQALLDIRTSNRFYQDELRGKYLTYASNSVSQLSYEEESWLETAGTIRIGYLADYMPYCGLDSSTGETTGMMADLLAQIEDTYGLSYTTAAYGNTTQLERALQRGEVDAIFPVYGEFAVGEEKGMYISNGTIDSTMTLVGKGETGEELSNAVVAVSQGDPFQGIVTENEFPQAVILYCDSLEDCIQAVRNGKADFTLLETGVGNEIRNTAGFSVLPLPQVELPLRVNVSFGVAQGQSSLLAVLNKGIQSDGTMLAQSIIQNSKVGAWYSAGDFVREYIEVVVLGAVGLGVVLSVLVLTIYRGRKRRLGAEQKAREAQWDARHDPLTGLLNRGGFQGLAETLKESREPLGLLIVDVDHFKEVNDTGGHDAGDRALIQVAGLLQQVFREGDDVVRYAGDEFLVLVKNVGPAQTAVLGGKIQRVNQRLQSPEEGGLRLSVSAGLAFSPRGYRDDLFKEADEALYRAKAKGRCGYSI